MSTAKNRARKERRRKLEQAQQMRAQLDGTPSPADMPPARIAYVPVPVKQMKELLELPEDLEVVGIQISEDGSTLALLVEGDSLAQVKYGEAIPMYRIRIEEEKPC